MVTVIVLVTAVFTYRSSVPEKSYKKEILFPGLSDRINDISKIVISGNNNSVTLLKEADQWVIGNADNYPAIFDKVRAVLVNLSELRIVADKTDNPELYSRLGVQGHDKKASPSLLVTLYVDQDNAVTSLIVGHSKSGKSGSKLPGWYVRRPETPGALLVEGHLDISALTNDWFNRRILDISSSRIMEINIEHPDKERIRLVKSHKGQVDFELLEPDVGDKQVLLIVLSRLGKALEELNVDGVRNDENIVFPDQYVRTKVTTFDGLVIDIKSANINGRNYSRFFFTSKTTGEESKDRRDGHENNNGSTDPAKEADSLNKLMSGWVYELPEFKYSDITASLSDIAGKKLPDMGNMAPGNDSLPGLDFPSSTE